MYNTGISYLSLITFLKIPIPQYHCEGQVHHEMEDAAKAPNVL